MPANSLRLMKSFAPSCLTSSPFSSEETTPTRVGAGQRAQLRGEHAEPAGGAPDQHPVAGLQLDLVDQHAVGGEVGEAVGGGLFPRQVLRLRHELLRLHLRELGEGAPARLVAPDLLRGSGQRVEAVHLDVLVGGLVAVDHDLVADLPLGDALADLPDHAGGVRAADVVVLLGVVAEHRDRLAERRPHVVEVHAGGHHAHDHLERAGLGDLDLLDLEGVLGLALALLADHPRRHGLRELAGLYVELAHVLYICLCQGGLPPWDTGFEEAADAIATAGSACDRGDGRGHAAARLDAGVRAAS